MELVYKIANMPYDSFDYGKNDINNIVLCDVAIYNFYINERLYKRFEVIIQDDELFIYNIDEGLKEHVLELRQKNIAKGLLKVFLEQQTKRIKGADEKIYNLFIKYLNNEEEYQDYEIEESQTIANDLIKNLKDIKKIVNYVKQYDLKDIEIKFCENYLVFNLLGLEILYCINKNKMIKDEVDLLCLLLKEKAILNKDKYEKLKKF